MSSVSMEMSLQKIGPHERKLLVTVPSEVFEAACTQELKKLSKTLKVDGFRPGKAILRGDVKKRVTDQARYEVINKMTDDSIRQTVENEKLILAGRPVLDIEKAEAGQPLKFSVTFDIYPEVTLKGLNPIGLSKPKVVVASGDIDEAIERLRTRAANWTPVEGAAKEGMRVHFKLTGKISGENDFFEKDAQMSMQIGSKEAIPGFEDALVGAVAGGKLSFDLPFPEDYFRDELAGKTAHFDLDVLSVEAPELPEIDEKFIKEVARVEAGTVDALRADVEKNLHENAKRMLNSFMKEELLQYLLKQHSDLSVPKGLIDQEVAALHHEHQHDHAHEEGAACGHTEEAERRVKLSLILGQYIRQEGIKLDEAKMYRAAMEMAFRTRDPKGELDNIYKTPRLRNLLASIILEEQAVNHLLERVQETEEALSYKELPQKLRALEKAKSNA
jgi:trigger factor